MSCDFILVSFAPSHEWRLTPRSFWSLALGYRKDPTRAPDRLDTTPFDVPIYVCISVPEMARNVE